MDTKGTRTSSSQRHAASTVRLITGNGKSTTLPFPDSVSSISVHAGRRTHGRGAAAKGGARKCLLGMPARAHSSRNPRCRGTPWREARQAGVPRGIPHAPSRPATTCHGIPTPSRGHHSHQHDLIHLLFHQYRCPCEGSEVHAAQYWGKCIMYECVFLPACLLCPLIFTFTFLLLGDFFPYPPPLFPSNMTAPSFFCLVLPPSLFTYSIPRFR